MTHRQAFYQNLKTSIPYKTTESYGQKTRDMKNNDIKLELNRWITGFYSPTHFLTIQLPENYKSCNSHNSKTHLRMIMKIFEKSLVGRHWNKKHLPFICVAENGTDIDWHYHILFNQGKFTGQELLNAQFKTNIILKLPSYCLELKPIEDFLNIIEAYCTKEIKVFLQKFIDSDRIILSHDLFYLPYKT